MPGMHQPGAPAGVDQTEPRALGPDLLEGHPVQLERGQPGADRVHARGALAADRPGQAPDVERGQAHGEPFTRRAAEGRRGPAVRRAGRVKNRREPQNHCSG